MASINEYLPKGVSNVALIIMIIITALLSFRTYQLYERVDTLERKIERSQLIQEKAFRGMKEENMFEDFINLEEFTEEEREEIREFAEDIKAEEDTKKEEPQKDQKETPEAEKD